MEFLKRKSLWIGVALLVVLSSLTLYTIIKELNGQDIEGAIRNSDPFWIVMAILSMLTYFFLDGLNIRRGLRLTGYKVNYVQMMKYSFAGFFFSSLTPSSTGGQPGQLYFMSQDKIRLSHGTFSLLCVLLCFQIGAVIWGIIGVILSPVGLFGLEGRFAYVFPIGFILNLLIILFLIFLIFTPKLSQMIACVLLKLNSLRHSKPGSNFKVLRTFAGYRHAAVLMKTNKFIFFEMLINSLFQIAFMHLVTFCSAKALGCHDMDWFSTICTQGALFLSVSSLPLPGSAGITEYGYALFYADVIPKELLGSVMLLARFVNFVLPLIYTGLALMTIHLIQRRRQKHSKLRL